MKIPQFPDITTTRSLVFLFERLLDRLCGLFRQNHVSKCPLDSDATESGDTYINEPLQILIEIGQILLSLVVLRDQGLFAFEELLSSLLQFLPFRVLMVDASDHEFMFAGLPVLRK